MKVYDYLIRSGVAEENIITIPLDDGDYTEYTDPGKLYDYIKGKLTEYPDQTVWRSERAVTEGKY